MAIVVQLCFFFFFLDGVVRCSDREEMTQEWNLGPESNLI